MRADVLIGSHPRSGGRWLRYLVAHYLAGDRGLDFDLKPANVFSVVPDHDPESVRGYAAFEHRGRRDLPLVAVCHEPYSPERHRGLPVLFLARNAYDVVVSAYHHLTNEKGLYRGSMRDFIRDPRYGLASWTGYMNSWARRLLTHRDVEFLAYGQLASDPAASLVRVLRFLNEDPNEAQVAAAVSSAQALRDERRIRTGQEGNFWDHLQPDEIFDIQEMIDSGLSEFSVHLLRAIGVDLDPFPRSDA